MILVVGARSSGKREYVESLGYAHRLWTELFSIRLRKVFFHLIIKEALNRIFWDNLSHLLLKQLFSDRIWLKGIYYKQTISHGHFVYRIELFLSNITL